MEGRSPGELALPEGDGNNRNPLIGSMVKNNIRLPGEVLLSDVPADAGLRNASADGFVYAVWSQSAVVPVPPAIVFFAAALIGLAGLRRASRVRPD